VDGEGGGAALGGGVEALDEVGDGGALQEVEEFEDGEVERGCEVGPVGDLRVVVEGEEAVGGVAGKIGFTAEARRARRRIKRNGWGRNGDRARGVETCAAVRRAVGSAVGVLVRSFVEA